MLSRRLVGRASETGVAEQAAARIAAPANASRRRAVGDLRVVSRCRPAIASPPLGCLAGWGAGSGHGTAPLPDTGAVTYDLIVLPVDRQLSTDEAAAEVDRLRRSRGFGFGHDRRLDPFIAAMGRRYWQLRARTPIPAPFEFSVERSHVFVGIPWTRVEEVVAAVAEAAFESGVAVWDPQRRLVGLPAAFADAPLTTAGTDVHVTLAGEAVQASERMAMATPMDPGDAERGSGEPGEPGAAGEVPREGAFQVWSPLGFEVTPDLADEVAADPARMPASLQTGEHRQALLRDLGEVGAPSRHRALAQLAGWDPDPAVAAALRPLLASDDVYEASQAAAGLARQGDITDLPGVMEVLHRFSPADGATAATMIVPLRAALALAELAGPEIVEGVRVRARAWRAAGPAHRRVAWEREADAELDALLG